MPVTVTPVGFPPFTFDAVTLESHEHSAEPTEYPVEEGADITDNVRQKADVFSVTGVITQTPTGRLLGGFDGPLVLDVEPFIPPPFQQLSAALLAITGSAPIIVQATQNAIPYDLLTDAHTYLLGLKEGAVFCDVSSSTHEYTDMILQSVGVQKKEAGAIEVSLSFKHITTVSTATVAAPLPTIPAGSPKVSAGPQGPAPTPAELKATLLKAAKDGIAGVVGG